MALFAIGWINGGDRLDGLRFASSGSNFGLSGLDGARGLNVAGGITLNSAPFSNS
jgi:hypothetical protein